MKKLPIILLAASALLSSPLTLSAGKNHAPTAQNAIDPEAQKEIKALESRLFVIKATDKSKLSRKDKKALRDEVKSIEKKMATHSGGVYISAGAVLLIIILLIIFL